MVHVGDKVVRIPRTIESMVLKENGGFGNVLKPRPMRGEVIYVHPKGRFHVVEFTNSMGIKMRETFWGVE